MPQIQEARDEKQTIIDQARVYHQRRAGRSLG
jgi:hypothetical protein